MKESVAIARLTSELDSARRSLGEAETELEFHKAERERLIDEVTVLRRALVNVLREWDDRHACYALGCCSTVVDTAAISAARAELRKKTD